MNDIDQIKEILFGNEKKAIDALVRRLETPESRTADVADVLPDAVTRSYNRDDRLGRALSQPVENSISEAIRREPKKFADALFPIMGPAIRKSIAEALKSTLQMINEAMETKFSPSVRYKAWRAGVPYHMWVFRQSLIYRVDEVYLVDPESGLLVSYLHHPDIVEKDEDAVSAMLTAIQDFVRDSFVKGNGGGLDSVVIGEYTVWISQGPHAMLACVIRGVPPVELKGEIAATNERIHLRHSQGLLNFDGHTGSVPGLDVDLEELLTVKRHQTQSEDNKKPLITPPIAIAGLVLLGLVGFWLIKGFLLDQKMDRLSQRLRAAPGIFTTDIERDGGRIEVKGLRDPLALDPVTLAQSVGLDPDKLDIEFLTFQSLDAEMVELRATQILQPPAGVELELRNQTLFFNGRASAQWREKADTLVSAIGGVATADFSGLLEDDASLLKRLKDTLQPPNTVDIKVTQGIAILSGNAPLSWLERLEQVPSNVPQLVDLNSDNLISTELVKLRDIVRELEGRRVHFISGTTLNANQEFDIAHTSNLVREYERLSEILGLPVRVQINGHADGLGEEEMNRILMLRRANAFRDMLISGGVNPRSIVVGTGIITPGQRVLLDARRAELTIPTDP